MPTPPLPDEIYQAVTDAFQAALDSGHEPNGIPSPSQVAAKALGWPVDKTRRRYYVAVERGFKPGAVDSDPLPIPCPELELPQEELDYEEIKGRKLQKFEKTKLYETSRKLIPVTIPYQGHIIGIHGFGDLHLDDDGCDLGLALEHCRLIREHNAKKKDGGGVFGISIGDHLNNWIGGLARKYASQATTLAEAHVLAEGFINELKGHWLCLIGGNHDEWGSLRYFLDKIARDVGTRYIDSAAGLGITFPNGNLVRLRLAHQLKGSSIYNAAAGPTRDSIFRYRWEITLAGHIHQSGYVILKQEDTAVLSHAVQLSSYQIFNHHAREKQFKDAHISPCAFLVINGTLPNTHPDMVKVFWHPEEGLDWLRFLQKKHDK